MISGSTYGALTYYYNVGTLSWVAGTQPVINTDTLTVTLPATAATAARQDTGNTSLASIDSKITTVNTGAVVISSGTVTTVGAVTNITNPVHTISDSGTITTVGAVTSITNSVAVTNANLDAALSTLATASAQTTGNTSLGTIKTNTDPLVAAGAGGYVRQDSTATIAKETGGNLATVKTNTDPLVAAGGGGYIRQDSTATIAKESGGNLATLVTNTTGLATTARQDTGNASLANIDTSTSGLSLAQAATTSGQRGVLTMAAVETLPAQVIDATTVALSLTSEKRLRVDAGSGAEETATLMRAMLRRLDLLGAILDSSYRPPDRLYTSR